MATLALGMSVFLQLSYVFGQDGPEQVEGIEFFEKSVRPVLVERCYRCHSGQARKLKAELRLDSRAALLAGGESGPAVVPGQPDESLLIQAVRYESFEMPPDKKLSSTDIGNLERWIRMGAPWPEEATAAPREGPEEFDWRKRRAAHWAWQPLREFSQRESGASAAPSGKSPVDAWWADSLRQRGLVPAQPANRPELVRRVYFDLIGLPPTPAELERWLEHPDANWFGLLVAELLGSPHFGEHWGRHWLDLVRYAESFGHEFDYPLAEAYQYRDYVIRAINADVPYDQWVVEHIAGDLVAPPRMHPSEGFNESILGTGFWWLGEAVHGPTDSRADEALRIDNQIDVLSKAFLGLTVACARCHDHKFDAIPTEDYYALAGFLQSSRRQLAPLDPRGHIAATTSRIDAVRTKADTLQRQAFSHAVSSLGDTAAGRSISHERLRRALAVPDEARKSIRPSHPLYAWVQMAPHAVADPHDWARQWNEVRSTLLQHRQQVADFDKASVPFWSFPNQGHQNWSTTGTAFGSDTWDSSVWDWLGDRPYRGIPGVPHSGIRGRRQHGVLRSPTFELKHTSIHHRVFGEHCKIRLIVDGYFMDEFNELLFRDHTQDFPSTPGEWHWITQHNDLHHSVGHRAYLEYVDNGSGYLAVDQVRFSDGATPAEPLHPWSEALISAQAPANITELLEKLEFHATELQTRVAQASWTLADWEAWSWCHDQLGWRNDQAELTKLRSELRELDNSLAEPLYVLAMSEGTGEDEHVHIRGSHQNLGAAVPRRGLVALGGEDQPPIARGSGRLELARHITGPENPLFSRVAVNRIWHHLFGRGIVPTLDDFGVMGQPPSHPELLDWLAGDFVHHGYSLKHTIRTVVMSAAYRQASRPSDARDREADPDNVWLSWHPVKRLPAESIRDALVTLSGTRDPELHGASVPVHLTPFMQGRGRPESGPLDGQGRRSIYLALRRNFLPPFLVTFDFPTPFSCRGRRSVSNVPAQSLTMLNDPFVAQVAERWSRRLILEEPSSIHQRIHHAYREAFGRDPTTAEQTCLEQYLAEQSTERGCGKNDADLWTDLCHTLLNTKEFIFLE